MSGVSVSIIIPTYNRAKLIKRSIQSVLNQTYRDFEIIVVDDGSTDETEDIIKEIADSRIIYIKCRKNGGAPAARNVGIEAAKGIYIAFQDSDDEWLNDKLEKQVNMINNSSSDVGVVYTGYWKFTNAGKIYIPSPAQSVREGNIHNQLLLGNFISTQCVLIKKECLNKSGIFDINFSPIEDWELWLRVSKIYKFKLVDEPLVRAYVQKDSISTNQESVTRAFRLLIEKHREDFTGNKKLHALYQYQIGNMLCQTDKIQEGKEHLRSALKLNAANPKYISAYFISFLGKNIYSTFAAIKRSITAYREKRYAKYFR